MPAKCGAAGHTLIFRFLIRTCRQPWSTHRAKLQEKKTTTPKLTNGVQHRSDEEMINVLLAKQHSNNLALHGAVAAETGGACNLGKEYYARSNDQSVGETHACPIRADETLKGEITPFPAAD